MRIAPALDTIRGLSGPLDLVFIDADKKSYSAYFDAVFPLLRQGGLIVADNTLWAGKVLDPQTDGTRAIVAYNAKVAADPRVARVLLTVRDGMLLSQKL